MERVSSKPQHYRLESEIKKKSGGSRNLQHVFSSIKDIKPSMNTLKIPKPSSTFPRLTQDTFKIKIPTKQVR